MIPITTTSLKHTRPNAALQQRRHKTEIQTRKLISCRFEKRERENQMRIYHFVYIELGLDGVDCVRHHVILSWFYVYIFI